jgi:hypothetical protein
MSVISSSVESWKEAFIKKSQRRFSITAKEIDLKQHTHFQQSRQSTHSSASIPKYPKVLEMIKPENKTMDMKDHVMKEIIETEERFLLHLGQLEFAKVQCFEMGLFHSSKIMFSFVDALKFQSEALLVRLKKESVESVFASEVLFF